MLLQTNFDSFHPFLVEDLFIRNWFKSVILNFEAYGTTELSHFRNYEINYEFEQPMDFANRVIFKKKGNATLIAQKVNVEYVTTAGRPVIRVIRKNKRKSLLAYGKN